MNIYAKGGSKVRFAHPNDGHAHNRELAKKHLEVNKVYTVNYTDVSDWHTDVYLREIPGIAFNSVLFEDA